MRHRVTTAILGLALCVAVGCGGDADGGGEAGSGGAQGGSSSGTGGVGPPHGGGASGGRAAGGTMAAAGSSGSSGSNAGGAGAAAAAGAGMGAPRQCAGDFDNMTCTDETQTCATAKGCCGCAYLPACSMYAIWVCIEPSTDSACGTEPPAAGAACTSPGTRCQYCRNGAPIVRTCVGGAINAWNDDALRLCR